MTKAEQGRAGQAPGHFGILLIDKPAGPTSHDVVGWVRWALRERSVGHCGTLDPAATGLLVVCVGAATKLVEYLTAVDKRYVGRFVLGRSTTTADAQGETLAEVELPADAIDRATAALAGLVGSLELPPPAYSAVKIAGRRAHDLARAGEEVELPLRPMAVEQIELVDRGPDWIDADLTVTKGTYVRSLAEELGRRVGLPAHLGGLRRIACGSLSLDDELALTGLRASELPAIEGRPPRWRIAAPPDPKDPAKDPRDRAAEVLRGAMAPAWQRLPFPVIELAGTDHAPLVDRLAQGQRIRVSAQTSAVLDAEAPAAELQALVDRAGGRMIIIRRDPDQRRYIPVRVLRFPPRRSPTDGS